jgi:hypothetical protein
VNGDNVSDEIDLGDVNDVNYEIDVDDDDRETLDGRKPGR